MCIVHRNIALLLNSNQMGECGIERSIEKQREISHTAG